MTLNRDQVVKALECCVKSECNRCPLRDGRCANGEMGRLSLTIIKELTVENEILRERYRILDDSYEKLLSENGKLGAELMLARWDLTSIKLNTIQNMQAMIKEECIAGGIYPAFVARVVESVGKKLLED